MVAKRLIVRLGIPPLLVAACAGAAAVSWHAARSEIPGFAFHSHVVLAVQIALLLFYGSLLLLVPLVRALFDGDLPIELSLRGARWTEELPGFGRDFVTRQEIAEADALRADADRKEEIRLLRKELREVDQIQKDVVDSALRRIKALEEKTETGSTAR
ncbi:MAG TPA: hypothetical protein VHA80_06150 [Solirubrobacterales bacterium]|nr:hypothetical protein [Solirubrobacterales bacterium]